MYAQYPKGSKTGPQPIKFAEANLSGVRVHGNVSYEYAFDAVDDQGQHGTCVANASAALFEFFLRKRRQQQKEVSRYAIYNQAKLDNPGREDMQDDGIYVSDGLNVLKTHGYIEETDFPYVDTNLLATPPQAGWKTDFALQDFVSVPSNVDEMKKAMSLHGPIIMGTTWAAEWEGDVGPDGMLPRPATRTGGHCVLLIGYSDTKQCFRGRNSWGPSWGDKGYFWLPYEYSNSTYSQFWPSDLYTVRA